MAVREDNGKEANQPARTIAGRRHPRLLLRLPPSPTSYGSLPGGAGLKNTLDALREQGPIVRTDAGDFAAPGALATLSGGTAGFAAAAGLGIDVGVVGNHEFEWGVEHLRTHAPKTGYPLLCANAPEVGLPPTAVVETEVGPVGFVGLTCPDPEGYVFAPSLEPNLGEVTIEHAKSFGPQVLSG